MTTHNYRAYIGIGGVPPQDRPIAYLWERRLHWLMLAVALLTVPTFYLEIHYQTGFLKHLGQALDLIIVLAFTAEFIWMHHVVAQKSLYILHNWLNLLIILGAVISLTGIGGEWLPLARLFRLAYVSLIIARLLGSVRNLFTPGAVPYLLAWMVIIMLLSGGGFYWLEPTVHSYSQGLWLAFTTGATVGYGDIVPTTDASRLFAAAMVVLGFAMLSVVTASIAAFFIGEDERKMRGELHHDIRELRKEVHNLHAELTAQREKKDVAIHPDRQMEKH